MSSVKYFLSCFALMCCCKEVQERCAVDGSGGGQNIKTDEQGSPSNGLMAAQSSSAPYQRYRRPAYSVPHAEPSLRASIGQSGDIQSQVRSAVVTHHRP